MKRADPLEIYQNKRDSLRRQSTFSFPSGWNRNCRSICKKFSFLLFALQTHLHNNYARETQISFALYLIFFLAKQQQIVAIETKSKSFPLLDKIQTFLSKLSTVSESGSATSILLASCAINVLDLPRKFANMQLKTKLLASMDRALPFDAESFRYFKPKPGSVCSAQCFIRRC